MWFNKDSGQNKMEPTKKAPEDNVEKAMHSSTDVHSIHDQVLFWFWSRMESSRETMANF